MITRPTPARAITVKQPWAWAIAHGGKTIENRTRGTSHRGLLLIHAGKSWSAHGIHDRRVRDSWTELHPSLGIRGVLAGPLGAVIATAQLVDAHPDADCCRPWGESNYIEAGGRHRTTVHHLVLEDVAALDEPVPARGSLGLWAPTPDLLRAVGVHP